MTCHRSGCPNEGKPKYCSRRCAALSQPPGHFKRLSALGHAGNRKKGVKVAPRPHEVMLMARGRYDEATKSIYLRAYSAGFNASKNGHRQLPPQEPGLARAQARGAA